MEQDDPSFIGPPTIDTLEDEHSFVHPTIVNMQSTPKLKITSKVDTKKPKSSNKIEIVDVNSYSEDLFPDSSPESQSLLSSWPRRSPRIMKASRAIHLRIHFKDSF